MEININKVVNEIKFILIWKKSDFTSQSNYCSVIRTNVSIHVSIGNTICELIKSCCKMITWNKAPLNNFFVSPPSLMDFGWIWLSCEERRGKLEWFTINYRKTFLLSLTVHHFSIQKWFLANSSAREAQSKQN